MRAWTGVSSVRRLALAHFAGSAAQPIDQVSAVMSVRLVISPALATIVPGVERRLRLRLAVRLTWRRLTGMSGGSACSPFLAA